MSMTEAHGPERYHIIDRRFMRVVLSIVENNGGLMEELNFSRRGTF